MPWLPTRAKAIAQSGISQLRNLALGAGKKLNLSKLFTRPSTERLNIARKIKSGDPAQYAEFIDDEANIFLGFSKIRGVDFELFCNYTSDITSPTDLNIVWKHWRNKDRAKLESYITSKGLNFDTRIGKSWPPCNGFWNIGKQTFAKGTKFDRYANFSGGAKRGKFASPLKNNSIPESFDGRALPYEKTAQNVEYVEIELLEPMELEVGEAMGWFGKSGGAQQVMFKQNLDELARLPNPKIKITYKNIPSQ